MDHSTSIAVMLLATTDWWCFNDLPHSTVCVVGKTTDESLKVSQDELLKHVQLLALLNPKVVSDVIGTDVFGQEEKVDVLRLRPTPIMISMRNRLRPFDGSVFPYNPHATVGPVGSIRRLSEVPAELAFDRIMVSWGEDNTTFRLR